LNKAGPVCRCPLFSDYDKGFFLAFFDFYRFVIPFALYFNPAATFQKSSEQYLLFVSSAWHLYLRLQSLATNLFSGNPSG
jgi:hypothetical protein